MKTRDMTLIALFAALTAIGAFLKIQVGMVPFTFQFFFCAFAGVFLGARKGFYSQLLYLGIGLIGIPIFANGGGPTYIFQPTFGYLIGFAACATLIGFLTERMKSVTFIKLLTAVFAGMLMMYVVGVPYLYMIVKLYMGNAAYTLKTAIVGGFLPYIGPDIVWCFIVTSVSMLVLPRLRKAGYISVIDN